jgi:TPR repeat protein
MAAGRMNEELTRLMALAERGRQQEVEAWARPRAVEGNADAQFILGYLVNTGAPVDFESSCDWWRQAAAQDHAEAIYQLSRIDESWVGVHSRAPINDKMRALLRRAAELGSERAQHDLAGLLATGHGGFAKNEAEARGWHERAAQAGNLQSQDGFGTMCLRGEGGPAMIADGIAWLEKAAAADLSAEPWAPLVVSSSALTLSLAYERGLWGVDPDPEKAASSRARLAAARAVLDRHRADDDTAVGRDAEGNSIRRPFAFANPEEATAVLVTHMASYRERSYADLVGQLDTNLIARLPGPSGLEYEALVRISWDDQPDGAISVGGSIEDFGWRTYQTISHFFSMTPDGAISDH